MTRRATVYVLAALACGVLAAVLPPLFAAVLDTTYPVALVAARALTAQPLRPQAPTPRP